MNRTGRALLAALIACVAVGFGAQSAAADPQIERSIVRILNHSQRGDWYAPWSGRAPSQSTGSGFVVSGGLVMTNAHVVRNARALFLFLGSDPRPHEARVRHIAHDCDLALIEPLDPSILEGIPKLRFGKLPQLGTTVETYGYPSGGQRISSTRGVVSRVEVNLYSHSGLDYHVTVQTDAAINPGNSGGPVVQNGRVVGVAFQAASRLENVGFFIPPEVVDHFLVDVEDGQYDGYPALGALTSNLENPAARARAGLTDGTSGVRVDFVFPNSSGDGLLEPGDVILEADGFDIANDGTVETGGSRLNYGAIVDRHQIASKLRLRVLRNGDSENIEIEMKRYPPLDRYANLYDRLPRYYIYGGLVFVPLDREMLKTYGDDYAARADKHLVYEFFHRFMEEPERLEREPVVLLRRLDHPANAQMAWYRNLIVERVNGQEIEGLADLVEAFEEHEGEHHLIEFGYYGRFAVLDREKADAAGEEVLERYGVPEDRRL